MNKYELEKERIQIALQEIAETLSECICKLNALSKPEEIASSESDLTLWELWLSVRTMNSLDNAEIFSLEKLLNHSVRELRRLKGVGDVTLSEVRKELAKHGLHLRGDKEWFQKYVAENPPQDLTGHQ